MLPAFFLYAAVVVASFSSVADVNNLSLDLDLQAMIKKSAIHQPEVFHTALQIVDTMNAAPSCNKLATATLINSCRSLEMSQLGDRNLYTALDQIKSVFAARLALCELTGAHAVPPPTCASMLPVRNNVERSFRCLFPGSNCDRENTDKPFVYPKVSSEQTKGCLSALESRPQWWTSYSNARQNAIVMCHAARGEIEKDELLQLHKNMIISSSDTSKALEDATDRARSAQQEHEQFVKELKVQQVSIFEDLRLKQTKLKDGLIAVVKGAGDSFQQLVEKLTSSAGTAMAGMDTLSENIDKSTEQAGMLQKIVDETMHVIQEKNKILADSQNTHLERHGEKALALQESLESIHANQIKKLTVAFMGIQTELASSAQLLTLMHGRQEALEERLVRFTDSFHGLQEMANQLAEAQTYQEESQKQAFRALQIMMNQTSSSLDEIHSRMGSLGNTIEQKRQEIENLDVTGFLGPLLQSGKFLIAGAGIVVVGMVAVKLIPLCTSLSWPFTAKVSKSMHLDSYAYARSHYIPKV